MHTLSLLLMSESVFEDPQNKTDCDANLKPYFLCNICNFGNVLCGFIGFIILDLLLWPMIVHVIIDQNNRNVDILLLLVDANFFSVNELGPT